MNLDTIYLRYNKTLKGIPSQCPCGQNYDETYGERWFRNSET